MLNLYNKNGLLVRDETAIRDRQMFVDYIYQHLRTNMLSVNCWFSFQQCEASILTPSVLINEWYTEEDVYRIAEDMTLRPETTMWSFEYARHILNPHNAPKFKLPLVVWQHGKSFRKEQDQPTKFMRLKEFYQLEFQIIYSSTTVNDYHTLIVDLVEKILGRFFNVESVASDRLPDYSEKTTDIQMIDNKMEICSISQRKDFYTLDERSNKIEHKVVEVAIGTDRLLYNFYN